jgi:NTP pyrophosphatase (non-canonical NTP hydrolase)
VSQHQPSFPSFVRAITKCPHDILSQLSPSKVNLIHAVFGVSGEAGELLDAVKKHVVYGKDLDHENIVEELGDLEFFLEMLRWELGISRDLVIQKNVEKLSKRYPNCTYTDKDALERKDKVNE